MKAQSNARMRELVRKSQEILVENSGLPSPEFRKQLLELLNAYKRDVEEADLSDASKAHYIDKAAYFVRWVHGEFQPGIRGSS